MTAPVLEARDLNRALLARQHLLARAPGGPGVVERVVERLAGLQAQNPSTSYTTLWSRIEGFTHDDLSQALLDRRVVRVVAMRGTIHLLTAQDALELPELLRPFLVRDLRTNPTYAPALRDVDLDELAAAARDVVEDEPLTPQRLGARLAERWDTDPSALATAARGTLALVQVTPRGVWGRSAATAWTTTRAWLGREPEPLAADGPAREAALDRLVLRYLAAYGPASTADVQYWCGLTGLGRVVDRLRDGLDVSRGASTATGRPGRELFDVPGSPRPATDAPAPVRFLADYDEVWIAHAERTRIIEEAYRSRVRSPNGVVPGRVLVDGFVRGTWAVRRGRAAPAVLEVTPFEPLTAAQHADVVAEGEAFARFVADDADRHEVRITA
ncbi:AlkZ family DNA glycosylase [Actinotalea ferrariae]|uniref:winged helix DNA-binding domain-containing protein n=1 Tax=Actinotalea ferrariae TaxID=1386098 RepID=UPI001C8C0526|nr:winged helix DNA-binding domain-containing protein [Actinotalea ferrariae]MBX9243389.1 AlkZ family DNA glycosylase [Actinotalea ferrariae]